MRKTGLVALLLSVLLITGTFTGTVFASENSGELNMQETREVEFTEDATEDTASDIDEDVLEDFISDTDENAAEDFISDTNVDSAEDKSLGESADTDDDVADNDDWESETGCKNDACLDNSDSSAQESNDDSAKDTTEESAALESDQEMVITEETGSSDNKEGSTDSKSENEGASSEEIVPKEAESGETCDEQAMNADFEEETVATDSADSIVGRGSCGDDLTWIMTSDGTLTISGTGMMYDYSWESVPWNADTVKTLIIEDGVTVIGDFTFHECYALTDITISDSVTSIGSCAFYGCTSLTSVKLSSSMESISTSMFEMCSNLTSIVIPDSVTSIGEGAFNMCSSLEDVVIPASVTSIGSEAFGLCKRLTNIVIPDGVTSIEQSTFDQCIRLENIVIPDSVEIIEGGAFGSCYSLKTIQFNGTKDQWEEIVIGDSNQSLLEVSVYCRDGIINEHGSVEELSGTCGENLSWTLNPEGILTVTGEGAMAGTLYDEDGEYEEMPWTEHATSIKTVVIESGVTTISGRAFAEFPLLSEVSLPDTLTDIGYGAFIRCESLTSITIPGSVSRIYTYAFGSCSNLSEAFLLEGVKEVGDMAFCGCDKLENISLPESLIQIGADSFHYTAWQDSMGEFAIYKGLLMRYQGNQETVVVPDSVTKIATFAFEDTELIRKIVLPEGLTRIEDSAFEWCFGLEEINIPSTVTYIGHDAFEECVSLKSIVIPESITEIKSGTFYYCPELKSVTIPSSVTSIGEEAFGERSDDLVIFGEIGSFAQQYADNNNIIFCDIYALSIADATITIPVQTYTGKALCPIPTVKLGGTTLRNNIDYTVVYANNTNVGTGTVTINGIGGYTGVKKATFKINKATQVVTAKSTASSIPVGKTVVVSISGAKGTKSFTSANPTIATVNKTTGVVTGKKPGTVKITAVCAATENYKSATTAVTIKIIPISISKAIVTCPTTKEFAGWALTPVPTVKLGSKILKKGTDFGLSFKNNKNVGIATITITGKGNYTGKLTKSFTIIPKGTTISKLSGGSKKFTVTWKKQAAQTTGYQIQYSSRSDFKTQKIVQVNNPKTVSKKISNLAKKRKYYVRIRTYKMVGNKKYYSSWSVKNTVTTK